MPKPIPTRSLPALAVALRQTAARGLPASTGAGLRGLERSPFYYIEGGDLAREVRMAAHTVGEIADKLRRLAQAYGEWSPFDAPAYFDLYPRHARLLLSVSERVSSVHVSFYADLLLPSFRRAERYWATEFFPAYQAGRPKASPRVEDSAFATHFHQIAQPKMVAYWQRAQAVIQQVRAQLSDDITFLAATGGAEERDFWQRSWPSHPARGVDPLLLPNLESVPSLTLAVSFPLPAHRQPGRLRRLRRIWRREWGLGTGD